MFLVLQSEETKGMAYDLGYKVGYFLGSNSFLIFLISGAIFLMFLFFLIKRRKKKQIEG